MTAEEEESKKRKRSSSDGEKDTKDVKVFKSSNSPVKEEPSTDEGIVEEFKLPKFNQYLNDFKIPSNLNSETSEKTSQEIHCDKQPPNADSETPTFFCKYCNICSKHPLSIKRHLQKKHRDVINTKDFEDVYEQIINNAKNIESNAHFDVQTNSSYKAQSQTSQETQTKGTYQIKRITSYSTPIKKPKIIRPKNKKVKPIECPKCSKIFVQLAYWRKHVLKCKVVPDYECKFCDVTSNDSTVILKHVINQHGKQIKPGEFQSIYQSLISGRKNSEVLKNKKSTEKKKSSNVKKAKVHKESYLVSENTSKIKMYCKKCNEYFDTMKEGKRVHIPSCPNCQSSVQGLCPKCNKLYTSFKSTRLHVEFVCDPQNVFCCNDCNYKTQNKMYIKHHVHKYHFETVVDEHVKCPNCDAEFKSEILKEIHKKNCLKRFSKNKFTCDICYRQYKQKCDLRRHIRTIHADNQYVNYKCKLCPYESKQSFILTRHMNQAHAEEQKTNKDNSKNVSTVDQERNSSLLNKIEMYCKSCDKSFPTLVNGKRSVLSNCSSCNEILQGKCPKCKNIYKSYKSTRVHVVKICNPKNKFQCNECDFETTNKVYLKYHSIQKHLHVELKDQVACSRCERKFKALEIMRQHMKTCDIERKFRCDYCNVRFKSKKIIRRHIVSVHINSDIQNFECKFCNFEAKHKTFLTKHIMQKHADVFSKIAQANLYCVKCEKTFEIEEKSRKRIIMKKCPTCDEHLQGQCSKCDKVCKSYKSARAHIQYFCDPLVSITCKYCNRNLPNQKYLKEHVEKMHLKCTMCNKMFETVDLQQEHLPKCPKLKRKKTPKQEIYNCDQCSLAFREKARLEEHTTFAHVNNKKLSDSLPDHLPRNSNSKNIKNQNKAIKKVIFEVEKLKPSKKSKKLVPKKSGKICNGKNQRNIKDFFTTKLVPTEITCMPEIIPENMRAFSDKKNILELTKNWINNGHFLDNWSDKENYNGSLSAEPAEPQVFGCEFCRRQFLDTRLLSVHMKCRHNDIIKSKKTSKFIIKPKKPGIKKTEKGYNCHYCYNQLISRKALVEHIKNLHLKSSNDNKDKCTYVYCDYCGGKYKYRRCILKHIRIKHSHLVDPTKPPPKEYLNCKICDKRFLNEGALSNHIKHRHTEKRVEKKYKNLWTLKEDRPSQYTCFYCGSQHSKRSSIIHHLRKHHYHEFDPTKLPRKKYFECEECGRTFLKRNSLYIHMKSQHLQKYILIKSAEGISEEYKKLLLKEDDPSYYTCYYCNGKFKNRKSFIRHLNDRHSQNVKYMETKQEHPYINCGDCDRRYLHRKSLALHRQIYHNEKKIRLRELKKMYLFKEDPPSAYTCHHCGKQMKNKRSLYSHLNKFHIHEIDPTKKPPKDHFDCKHCNSRFSKRNLLYMHMKYRHRYYYSLMKAKEGVHITFFEDTPVYGYCHYCGYKCKYTNLLNHMRRKHFHIIHSTELPPEQTYQCKVCSHRFLNKGALTTHIKYKHKDIPKHVLEKTITAKATQESAESIIQKGDTESRNQPMKKEDIEIIEKPKIKLENSPSIQSFECKICNRQFANKTAFVVHIKFLHHHETVNNKKPEDLNAEKSNKSVILKNSVERKNELEEYNSCDSQILNKTAPLTNQQKSISDEESIMNNNENDRESSRSIIIESESLNCRFCYDEFVSKNELETHIKNRHKIDVILNFQCKLCSFEANHKRGLISHMKKMHAMNIDAFVRLKAIDGNNVSGFNEGVTIFENSVTESTKSTESINGQLSSIQKNPSWDSLFKESAKNEDIVCTSKEDSRTSILTNKTQSLDEQKFNEQSRESNNTFCLSEGDLRTSVLTNETQTLDEKKSNQQNKESSILRANSIANTLVNSVVIVREIYRQPRVFNCDYCYNQYYIKRTLIKHIHSKHMTPEGNIILLNKCPICFYETKSKELFDRHVMKHTTHKSNENVKKKMNRANIVILSRENEIKKEITMNHVPETQKMFASKILQSHSSVEIVKSEIPSETLREKWNSELSSKHYELTLSTESTTVDKSYDYSESESLGDASYKKCIDRLFKQKPPSEIVSEVNANEGPREKYATSSKKSKTWVLKNFPSQHSLKNKSENKSLQRQEYCCNECSFKTRSKVEIKIHMKKKHKIESQLFKCRKCDKRFKSMKVLENHEPICQMSFDYKCTFCSMKTKHNGHIKRHLRNVHGNIIEDVDEVFKKIIINRREYKQECIDKFREGVEEINTSSEKENPGENIKYYCNRCRKIFATRENNKKIQMEKCPNCQAVVQSKCTKCNKLFESYLCAYNHVTVTCNPLKKFVCNKCNYEAKTKRDLQRHIERIHTKRIKRKPFKCSMCKRSYQYAYSKNKHEQKCRAR